MTIKPFIDTAALANGHGIVALRVQMRNGQQKEVAIFPLELPITAADWPFFFNVTLHTTFGDATTTWIQIP